MTITQILKDEEFVEVKKLRVDSKRRISLGGIKQEVEPDQYRIYKNSSGQIILDPLVSIPSSEAWLFMNKKSIESVRRGLEDAMHGRVHESPKDLDKN
jgi:hypothetical protein